jgi:acyl dehydratase
MRAFEDFSVGETIALGQATITADDIVAFAREFDPQPFHLDAASPETAFTGGLIASGWHICAVFMRLLADNLLLDSTGMGSPGIDTLQWVKPVRPGDTISAATTVLETRPSRKRPEMGLVRFRHDATVANATVLSFDNTIMFGRRS